MAHVRCCDCRYWDPSLSSTDGQVLVGGLCRRHAPAPRHPAAASEDWCGDAVLDINDRCTGCGTRFRGRELTTVPTDDKYQPMVLCDLCLAEQEEES